MLITNTTKSWAAEENILDSHSSWNALLFNHHLHVITHIIDIMHLYQVMITVHHSHTNVIFNIVEQAELIWRIYRVFFSILARTFFLDYISQTLPSQCIHVYNVHASKSQILQKQTRNNLAFLVNFLNTPQWLCRRGCRVGWTLGLIRQGCSFLSQNVKHTYYVHFYTEFFLAQSPKRLYFQSTSNAIVLKWYNPCTKKKKSSRQSMLLCWLYHTYPQTT